MPIPAASDTLVTLDEAKAHLGLTDDRHDDELSSLIAAATPVIERMVGAVIPRTVGPVRLTGNVLPVRPALALVSLEANGAAVSGWAINAEAGLLEADYGYGGLGFWGSVHPSSLAGAVVTYTAGRATIPPEVTRAALRWVSWAWRRDHGGSESYMPGGDDATPGLGVAGIERELEHILGMNIGRTGVA